MRDDQFTQLLRAINNVRDDLKEEMRSFKNEMNRRWDENDKRWKENDKRWEENDKKWEENRKELDKIHEKIATINVFINARGKLKILVSVNNWM